MAEPALLLTVREVADMLGVSERTVRNLVTRGDLPPGRKVAGRLTRWHRRDVEGYADRVRWSGEAKP